MILILAWISRAVTCCAYRTGPERAADFLSGFDGGNKEPQNTHRVAPRHSLAHLHSHLRSSQRCWLRQSLCVCCCAFVYACVKRCCAWAHTVSQLHPAEALLLLGAATESRYETWHHSRRLTKTIRASPWTSHTSTFPPLFLLFSSSPPALSLIMPSQRESTQQHKHGYKGLYPVLHLRLCTFLHHVLMDNLTCPKKKHAWGHVHSEKKKKRCYFHSLKLYM